MLSASQIYKTYGELMVLKGIDLEVKKGEIVAIVGASGAGKSTLLHILGTLDRPERGSLSLNNTDIITLTAKQLSEFRNQNIGFIFQFHNLLPEFTVLENVCIPGYIYNSNQLEIEDRARQILDHLGMSQRLHHNPSQLSGGEQQRTAVARALINQPAIVLADEPSGNLDSKNARELHQLFFDLRDQYGQTFVIVTHNEELAAMTDRKLEIVDGVMK
ncbi:MAG: ABC transporter ATP-binding protein [Cyclobacteriaceae bacterium]